METQKEFQQVDFKNIFESQNQKRTNLIRRTKSELATQSSTVDQETAELNQIERNTNEVDRIYQAQIDKKWSFMDKFKDRGMFEQVSAVKSDLIKQSGHFRIAYYSTVLEARLESLSEKANAGLKMMKGHYRKEVSSFLMQKMEEMAIEVKDRQFRFASMMLDKYDFLETLTKSATLYQRFEDQLVTEEHRYLDFLDRQLVHFESIVTEQIRKYH